VTTRAPFLPRPLPPSLVRRVGGAGRAPERFEPGFSSSSTYPVWSRLHRCFYRFCSFRWWRLTTSPMKADGLLKRKGCVPVPDLPIDAVRVKTLARRTAGVRFWLLSHLSTRHCFPLSGWWLPFRALWIDRSTTLPWSGLVVQGFASKQPLAVCTAKLWYLCFCLLPCLSVCLAKCFVLGCCAYVRVCVAYLYVVCLHLIFFLSFSVDCCRRPTGIGCAIFDRK